MTGDDIDTDRITPARFLKELTFENFGEYVFADERSQAKEKGESHPFDQEQYRSANFLIVNSNFGCGSSREHAAQSIKRWGIDCIIGESFSEIFYNNCIAVGVPCLIVDNSTAKEIQSLCTNDPKAEIKIDLESHLLTVSDKEYAYTLSDGVKTSFIEGAWDATSQLLESKEEILEKSSSLPY